MILLFLQTTTITLVVSIITLFTNALHLIKADKKYFYSKMVMNVFYEIIT